MGGLERTHVAVRAAVPDEGVICARKARVRGRVYRLHAAEEGWQAVERVSLDDSELHAPR